MKTLVSTAALTFFFTFAGLAPAGAADLPGEFARARQGAPGAPASLFPPAAPGPVSPAFCSADFTQSTNPALIVPYNSWACVSPGTSIHRDNTYWRAFQFDHAVNVQSVSFGVESAVTNHPDAQPVVVRLHANTGDRFPAGTRQLVSSAGVSLLTQAGTIVAVPITGTFPAGTELVVEINTPWVHAVDGFFIGSNAAGQSAPGYISAPDCGTDTPTATADLGFPNMHMIIDVTADECFECWSAIGAVGAAAPAASVSILGPALLVKPALTRASVTARFGLPALKLDGNTAILRVRYRDTGTTARVQVSLMRTDLLTGAEEKLATFDSNLAAASPDFQVGELTLPVSSFPTGVYWVQAVLDKTALSGKPALHSMQLLWTGAAAP
jgi:hypothetical protein